MAAHSITPTYTAHVQVTGGREGTARSDDGVLDLTLKRPGASGGDPKATNPEQLFAAGYAACFQSALFGAGRQAGVDLSNSVVATNVSIGKEESGGFGLGVAIRIHVPGMDLGQAQDLADQAHQNCPYSRATRGNIDVTVEAVESI